MAQLLEQIEWGPPLLARAADAAWEAEAKKRSGTVSEVDRRVAPNPWIRELCVEVNATRPKAISQRLFNIVLMVTAQENSCRYCYGANRAYLKILGYSEKFITRIERDLQLAELDDKDRAAIAFSRNLARSRPRPARAERDALVGGGFSRLAVHEIALVIALSCFYNRIGILIACPPEHAFERMANGVMGRLIGAMAPLTRALMALKPAAQPRAAPDAAALGAGPFGPALAELAGLPGATMLRSGIDAALESRVLSRATKALIFAIVARTIACSTSEREAKALLPAEGFSESEADDALATLDCRRLSPGEAALLPWARDTVYYQTARIQERTRSLAAGLGEAAMLEAIGVAALANATVRLAMLLE